MAWMDMEMLLEQADFTDFDDSTVEAFSHCKLSSRLRKSFYYSPHKNPSKDTLSFSITKEAVKNFRKAAPSSFGKLGQYYASRVARDACVSPCSLLLAMIYIERLSHCNPEYLQNVSSADLFLVSVLVASKYLYDEGIDDEVYNDEWAASSLLDVSYLNSLEVKFLKAIDWKVFVPKIEFQQMLDFNEAKLALNNGLQRGWLSYTDMLCLWKSRRILQNFVRVVTVFSQAACICVVVYAGIVATCVGTVLIAQHVRHHDMKQFPVAANPLQDVIMTMNKRMDDVVTVNVNSAANVQLKHLDNGTAVDEQIADSMKVVASHPSIKPAASGDASATCATSRPAKMYALRDRCINQLLTILETVFFLSPSHPPSPIGIGSPHDDEGRSRSDKTRHGCVRCNQKCTPSNSEVKRIGGEGKRSTVQKVLNNSPYNHHTTIAQTHNNRDKDTSWMSAEIEGCGNRDKLSTGGRSISDVTHFHCTVSVPKFVTVF